MVPDPREVPIEIRTNLLHGGATFWGLLGANLKDREQEAIDIEILKIGLLQLVGTGPEIHVSGFVMNVRADRIANVCYTKQEKDIWGRKGYLFDIRRLSYPVHQELATELHAIQVRAHSLITAYSDRGCALDDDRRKGFASLFNELIRRALAKEVAVEKVRSAVASFLAALSKGEMEFV